MGFLFFLRAASSLFLALGLFKTMLELAQGEQEPALIFINPSLGDLVQRRGVEVVELAAPVPERDNEVCPSEQGEMFGYRLARHIEVVA